MRGRATQFTPAGGATAIDAGDIVIYTLVLTPAAAAAAVEIKEGGTGGTVVLSLAAAASGASVVLPVPFQIRNPFISTFTGVGATLTVVK